MSETLTGLFASGPTRRYSSRGTFLFKASLSTTGRRCTTGVPLPARSGMSKRASGLPPSLRASWVRTLSPAASYPLTARPKLSWKLSLLISPSVTTSRPESSCNATWRRMHSSSMPAYSPDDKVPDSKRARASFQACGRSRLPTTSVRMRSRLLMLDPGGLDGGAVALQVLLDEARVVVCAVLAQVHGEVGHALGYVALAQRLGHRALQALHHLARHAGRPLQADDGRDIETLEAQLLSRGHLGQRGRALRGADRVHAQLSGADMRE